MLLDPAGFFLTAMAVIPAFWLGCYRQHKWMISRPLFGWTEPFPGDLWFVDGRLVRVIRVGPEAVSFMVEASKEEVKIHHRYWKRRARIAAEDPQRLLSMKTPATTPTTTR